MARSINPAEMPGIIAQKHHRAIAATFRDAGTQRGAQSRRVIGIVQKATGRSFSAPCDRCRVVARDHGDAIQPAGQRRLDRMPQHRFSRKRRGQLVAAHAA